MENKSSAPGISRWLRLALGSLVLLFSGIIYAWTAISVPFREFGWSATQLSLNFTITMCMFCIAGFVSGLVGKKLSGAVKLMISAVLVGAGLVIVSLIDGSSLFQLYLGYGFMMGSGVGIVYNVVVSSTNAWFPDRKGLSSGALMMSFGLGSFVIGLLADRLFELIGWSNTYRLFGIVIGAVLVAAAILVKNPPSGAVSGRSGERDMSASQIVKRPSFWMLFVFFMLFAAVGSTAIADAKDMMGNLGVVSGVAVIALLVPVCNSLGRIASGIVFDKLGLRRTQYVTSGIYRRHCRFAYWVCHGHFRDRHCRASALRLLLRLLAYGFRRVYRRILRNEAFSAEFQPA